MDEVKFSLKSVYDEVNEQMIATKGKQYKSEHMLLKDRLGRVMGDGSWGTSIGILVDN